MYQKLRDLTSGMAKPLVVDGLHGRILEHPSRKAGGGAGRTIVFVYGIHGSLERFYGIIHFLARFGRVIVPDLPGMGGMESFYKRRDRPSADAYGDYLAKVIGQQLPEETSITYIALSYGFVVLTRMFVRHPELTRRTSLVISAMGLADGRDINLKGLTRLAARTLFQIGRTPVAGSVLKYITTRPWVLRLSYSGNNPKMKLIDPADRPSYIAFESHLWQVNDMKTYGQCMLELFSLRQPGAHVPLDVQHIYTEQDHWLDIGSAERHISSIYDHVVMHRSDVKNHGGTAYAEEAEAREIIPVSVTNLLEAIV